MIKKISVYNDYIVVKVGGSIFADVQFATTLLINLPLGSVLWDKTAGVLKLNLEYKREIIDIACDFYDEVDEETVGQYWERAYTDRKRRVYSEHASHEQKSPDLNELDKCWLELRTILGDTDITAIYRALSKLAHPDNGGNADKMAKINDIFSRLGRT